MGMCKCWLFCPICKTIHKHNWNSNNTGWYKWHESEDPLYCEHYKEYMKNKIDKSWYEYSAEEAIINEAYIWWEAENYGAIYGTMLYLTNKYSYIRPEASKNFHRGIIETKTLDDLESVYDKYIQIFEAVVETAIRIHNEFREMEDD